MTEAVFVHAALAYTKAKLKHLALKREIRERVCENVEEVNEPEHEYNPVLIGTPCWLESDGYGDRLSIEGWCDTCQKTFELVEKRRETGRTIAGLSSKLYAAYRWEIGGIDDPD